MRIASAVAAAAFVTIPTAFAQAAEITLIVAAPMAAAVKQLGAQFEKASGHTLSYTVVSGPIVKREIDGGASYDIAVSITPVIDALVGEGKLSADSRSDVAFAPVAVGVRAGAPKPDIGTVEAFRQTLLAARSVAHSASGASGDHFKAILQRLGIADEMRAKLRPMPAETIAQAVPTGEAEMIVVTASVILVPGAELVGPIPVELQFYNGFAAAVSPTSRSAAAARQLVQALTTPAAAPVLRAHGLEPGSPK